MEKLPYTILPSIKLKPWQSYWRGMMLNRMRFKTSSPCYLLFKAAVSAVSAVLESGRRRSHLRRPPTPPYVRFRIRRFTKQAGSVDVVPAVTKDHNDQSRI